MRRSSAIALAALFVVIPLLAACQGPQTQSERSTREAAIARATKGKELFEEKCRTVAGEKIYRTVHDVKGIVLLKIRPKRGDRELSDQMWPGAAFAREATGDDGSAAFASQWTVMPWTRQLKCGWWRRLPAFLSRLTFLPTLRFFEEG